VVDLGGFGVQTFPAGPAKGRRRRRAIRPESPNLGEADLPFLTRPYSRPAALPSAVNLAIDVKYQKGHSFAKAVPVYLFERELLWNGR
jgi:hypothetical protein